MTVEKEDGPATGLLFEGVSFAGDLVPLVAEQLATGRHRGKLDGAPGDWLERALHALPPADRLRLTAAIHEALSYPDPEVRSGALRFFDGNSRLADPERLLDLVENRWDLFKGLRGSSDSPDTDRGATLVHLAANCATGSRGSRFRRSLALDKDYGGWVLAALVQEEPAWTVEHVCELVDPAIDPDGSRLKILVSSLKRDPQRLQKAVAAVAKGLPSLKPGWSRSSKRRSKRAQCAQSCSRN